jgi:hypothetical protein
MVGETIFFFFFGFQVRWGNLFIVFFLVRTLDRETATQLKIFHQETSFNGGQPSR